MPIFMYYYYLVLVILTGLAVGSFLAASAYRIPRKIPISRGRSKCPACGHTLNWYDLVPVFSFLTLKGKCRYCKTGISPFYAFTEFLNALIWTLIYIKYGLSPVAFIYATAASCLLLLSAIDLKHMIIPDRTLVIIMICGIVSAIFALQPETGIISRIIGFFAISLPFYIIAIVKPDGMGGGDIKLMAAAGFLLGWMGILTALVIGSCTGAVYGSYVLLSRRKKRNDQVPFGPFLSFGILIAMLYGSEILDWYLNLG